MWRLRTARGAAVEEVAFFSVLKFGTYVALSCVDDPDVWYDDHHVEVMGDRGPFPRVSDLAGPTKGVGTDDETARVEFPDSLDRQDRGGPPQCRMRLVIGVSGGSFVRLLPGEGTSIPGRQAVLEMRLFGTDGSTRLQDLGMLD